MQTQSISLSDQMIFLPGFNRNGLMLCYSPIILSWNASSLILYWKFRFWVYVEYVTTGFIKKKWFHFL